MVLPGAGKLAARALAEAGQHPKEYTAEELAQVMMFICFFRVWRTALPLLGTTASFFSPCTALFQPYPTIITLHYRTFSIPSNLTLPYPTLPYPTLPYPTQPDRTVPYSTLPLPAPPPRPPFLPAQVLWAFATLVGNADSPAQELAGLVGALAEGFESEGAGGVVGGGLDAATACDVLWAFATMGHPAHSLCEAMGRDLVDQARRCCYSWW